MTARAYELLTWEWQDVDALRRQIAPLVAPGKALRKYQMQRASYERKRAERGGTGPRQRDLSQNEKIDSGQRSLALIGIRSHIESGRAETRTVDGVRQIRLAQQVGHDGNCGGCGRPFPMGEQSTSPMSMSTPPTKVPKTKTTGTVLFLDQYRKTS